MREPPARTISRESPENPPGMPHYPSRHLGPEGRAMSRRGTTISVLEEHPNLSEILGVLAQLAHIRDADIPRLADAWNNTVAVAEARDRALSPDSPLVIEALAAFEAL